MLEAGQKFPEFDLKNQAGNNKQLASYEGKWLVLYVYPKDDTPGCTIQGKSFTETKDQFEQLNTVVVGLNTDDIESHQSFCSKYGFTIDLLSDPKGELLEKLGVGQKTFKGSLYWNRTTFLVDPKGTLRKVYTNVDPNGHEKAILTDLKELQK